MLRSKKAEGELSDTVIVVLLMTAIGFAFYLGFIALSPFLEALFDSTNNIILKIFAFIFKPLIWTLYVFSWFRFMRDPSLIIPEYFSNE